MEIDQKYVERLEDLLIAQIAGADISLDDGLFIIRLKDIVARRRSKIPALFQSKQSGVLEFTSNRAARKN